MAFKIGRKMKAGTDVWCSRSTDGLPNHQIAPLLLDIFASYSGPDKGLAMVLDLPIVQPVSPANQHLADTIPCACCDSLDCQNDPDQSETSPQQSTATPQQSVSTAASPQQSTATQQQSVSTAVSPQQSTATPQPSVSTAASPQQSTATTQQSVSTAASPQQSTAVASAVASPGTGSSTQQARTAQTTAVAPQLSPSTTTPTRPPSTAKMTAVRVVTTTATPQLSPCSDTQQAKTTKTTAAVSQLSSSTATSTQQARAAKTTVAASQVSSTTRTSTQQTRAAKTAAASSQVATSINTPTTGDHCVQSVSKNKNECSLSKQCEHSKSSASGRVSALNRHCLVAVETNGQAGHETKSCDKSSAHGTDSAHVTDSVSVSHSKVVVCAGRTAKPKIDDSGVLQLESRRSECQQLQTQKSHVCSASETGRVCVKCDLENAQVTEDTKLNKHTDEARSSKDIADVAKPGIGGVEPNTTCAKEVMPDSHEAKPSTCNKDEANLDTDETKPVSDKAKDDKTEIVNVKLATDNIYGAKSDKSETKPTADSTEDSKPEHNKTWPTPDNTKYSEPDTSDIKQTTEEVILDTDDIKPSTDDIKSSTEEVKPNTDDIKPSIDQVKPNTDDIKPSTEEVKPNTDDIKPSTEEVKPNTDDIKPSTEEVKPNTDDIKPSTEEVKPNTDDIKPSTEEVKPNTDDIKPSTEEVKPNTDDIKPSTEEVKPNTDDIKPSTEEVKPNTDDIKPSTEEVKPNTDDIKPSTEEVKPNTDDIKPSTEEVKPNTDDIKPSTEEVKPNTDDIKPSTEEVKPNTDDIKPSTEEVKPNTDDIKPSTEEVKPNTDDIKQTTEEAKPDTNEAAPTTCNIEEAKPDTKSTTDLTEVAKQNTKDIIAEVTKANKSVALSTTAAENGGLVTNKAKLMTDDTASISTTSGGTAQEVQTTHKDNSDKPQTEDANVTKQNTDTTENDKPKMSVPKIGTESINDVENAEIDKSATAGAQSRPVSPGQKQKAEDTSQSQLLHSTSSEFTDSDVFGTDHASDVKDDQKRKEQSSQNGKVSKSPLGNGTSAELSQPHTDVDKRRKASSTDPSHGSRGRSGQHKKKPNMKRTKSDSSADMSRKFVLPLKPGVITIYTTSSTSPKKGGARPARPTSMSDMPLVESPVNGTGPAHARSATSFGASPTKSTLVGSGSASHCAGETNKLAHHYVSPAKSTAGNNVTPTKQSSPVSTSTTVSPASLVSPVTKASPGTKASLGTRASPVTTDVPAARPETTIPPFVSKTCDVAGALSWNVKSRKAYGICMSLYDQNPVTGKISGEPTADAFAVCARKNSALLIVADGVNWGEKSMLAARCAVFGCVQFINQQLFSARSSITTTHEITRLLLQSLDAAQQSILTRGGGLTTLCVALVCPVMNSRQFVVNIVNVGDSLAYVFSKQHGVREITTGSHDISLERDIRDAGGALGPVNGIQPELHNLTCSMTFVDPGDIIYLTTDGISDNFDPVVTKIAVSMKKPEEGEGKDEGRDGEDCGTQEGKPEMKPHERHQYAVKEMERIIHEFELFAEVPCSAQELCGAILQHVLKLTNQKRQVLENPNLYGKKLRSKERKKRDLEILAQMHKAPGKLDHATIVGYEIGTYHGNDDEDYEMESFNDDLRSESPSSVQVESNV